LLDAPDKAIIQRKFYFLLPRILRALRAAQNQNQGRKNICAISRKPRFQV